ncbi:DUF3376 domain-containing protein [Rhodococcus wratislaviensis]|uniref:PNPLA domain-containing protein n=1 Tax=Rhodococcus wratislaviensis NBRC 100605 TaxID=1219028 RepID=X0RDF1_RHOWR|nr:DUF3376 domain-containing protein [Rhodococcus wratislaviensis]GAF49050.1 hypothetical protein RW1_066_00170 [Rhodococcus wratislaviensis NBRC 100605]
MALQPDAIPTISDRDASALGGDGRTRTLRLALAMRGGVSLAVWIGGAVAEIDALRRASLGLPAPDDFSALRYTEYRRLLDEAHYDTVQVDILAGASAGGLNAVLYGLAQSCGVGVDSIRDTWVADGGLRQMLRRPGFRRIESILDGDLHFMGLVRAKLVQLAERRFEAAQGRADTESGQVDKSVSGIAEHLTVELAATLLGDALQPDWGNSARFTFVRTPGDLETRFSTIPKCAGGVLQESDRAAIANMALAARATSSFPGAFEPATVCSVTGNLSPVNMTRVFPAARTPTGNPLLTPQSSTPTIQVRESNEDGVIADPQDPLAFKVVDGGVLDNIPIDRAIRAIGRAPASGPTERRLIYLDPEPPIRHDYFAATVEGRRESAGAWLDVIMKSKALKERNETAQDELCALLDHNHNELLARGRQDQLAEFAMRLGGGELNQLRETIGRYVDYRATVDAPRISKILQNPSESLAFPPREAREYKRLRLSGALRIKDLLIDAYRQIHQEENGIHFDTDIQAVLDTANLLIAWIRAIEDVLTDCAGDVDVSDAIGLLGGIKSQLYRAQTVGIEVRRHTVDSVLAEMLVATAPPGDQNLVVDELPDLLPWIRESMSRQRGLSLLPGLQDALIDVRTSETLFYQSLAEQWEAWQALSALEASEVAGGELLNDLMALLDQWRQQICLATPAWVQSLQVSEGPENAKAARQTWVESVFASLHVPTGALNAVPTGELHMVFAVTGGVPGAASMISYHMIGSDEPIASNRTFGSEFTTLVEASIGARIEGWIKRAPIDYEVRLDSAPELLTSDAKLSGNRLSRFGGFLSARWRNNDWYWGRMDAAAGIVRLLEPSNQNARLALQRSVLDQSSQLIKTAGAERISDLSPTYRLGLISRLCSLLTRVLWPAGGRWVLSWQGVARATALSVVARPLLALFALASAPTRAALAALIVAAVIVGFGRNFEVGSAGPGLPVLTFTALALAAVIVGRGFDTYVRWNTLVDRVKSAVGVDNNAQFAWIEYALRARRRARRFVALSFVVASVILFGTIAIADSVAEGESSADAEACVVALLAFVVLQQVLHLRAYQACSALPPQNVGFTVAKVVVLSLLLAAVVIGLPLLRDSRLDGHLLLPGWQVAAAAAVTTGVLAALSLWGWTPRWAATGSIAMIAGATFGLGWMHVPTVLVIVVTWSFGVSLATGLLPPRKRIFSPEEEESRESITPSYPNIDRDADANLEEQVQNTYRGVLSTITSRIHPRRYSELRDPLDP